MSHNLVRVHSTYSVIDGLSHPEDMAEYVKNNSISEYLPLTDYHNFFAYVKHYRACKRFGLTSIYGVDVNLDGVGRVVLHASTDEAFFVLRKIVSLAYKKNSVRNELMVTCEELIANCANKGVVLFVSASSIENLKVHRIFSVLVDGFESYELFDLYRDAGRKPVSNLPVVPTIDVFFNDTESYEIHEHRLAIQKSELMEGFNSQYLPTDCFHSSEKFLDLVSVSGLENPIFVQDIYEKYNVNVRVDVVDLPIYPFTGETSEDDFLREKVYSLYSEVKGFLKESNPNFDEEVYRERIIEELDVFVSMGYSGYFLIVWDYIKWAKENDVPVGVGRGSGAGSFVAFLLGIVGLDPIRYDLLFERFLNKERVSMPDIDTDFCSERRKLVIDYVVGRYGEEKASQICTFGTMSAKSVMADVARVYDVKIKHITDLIPATPKITLKEAIKEVPKLAEFSTSKEFKNIFDVSQRLEGGIRSVGRHPGGVVISRASIYSCSGLYYDDSGNTATMLDMNDAEAVGMVKFDFLALKNLSSVKGTIDTLAKSGIQLDINRIPLDDKKSFELLNRGLTQGVFQLYSAGMRSLIKRLKPTRFEDIIALVALFRPGPLQSGMVDNFIDRKHGKEPVCYPDPKYQHDVLKSVLEPTYGIILYQEQVMKIAQVMSGYTLGEADLLRRAMGKKKPEEMQQQKERFEEGAVANKIDRKLSEQIFLLVDKFSGYGFNKSHSAVYAFLAYQTLYLKAHYPAEFMSEVLQAHSSDHDKLPSLIFELGSYGVCLLSPNINTSTARFSAVENTTIAYGLSSIKGIGEAFAAKLQYEREKAGPFQTLEEFVERASNIGITKGQMERLIFAGCLDEICEYEKLLDYLHDNYGFEKTIGAISTDEESRDYNQKKCCGLSFKLIDMVGDFTEELALAQAKTLGELESIPNGSLIYCGGLVTGVKVINTKVTRLVANLRDSTGEIELVGWGDFLRRYDGVLKEGDLFIVEGKLGSFNDKLQLTLTRCWDKNFVRRRLGISK